MWVAHDDGIVAMRWAAALFEALALGIAASAVTQTRSLTTSLLASARCILPMNVRHAQ